MYIHFFLTCSIFRVHQTRILSLFYNRDSYFIKKNTMIIFFGAYHKWVKKTTTQIDKTQKKKRKIKVVVTCDF